MTDKEKIKALERLVDELEVEVVALNTCINAAEHTIRNSLVEIKRYRGYNNLQR